MSQPLWLGGTASPPSIPPRTHETFAAPRKGGKRVCFHATSPARANGPRFGCLRWGILEVSVLLNLTRETSSGETDMCTDRQRPAAPPASAGEPFLSLTHTCAPHLAPEHPSWHKTQGSCPSPRHPRHALLLAGHGEGHPKLGLSPSITQTKPPVHGGPSARTPSPAPRDAREGGWICQPSSLPQPLPVPCPRPRSRGDGPPAQQSFSGCSRCAGDHTPPDRQRVSWHLEHDTAHDRVTVLRAPSTAGGKKWTFSFASFSPQTHHDF